MSDIQKEEPKIKIRPNEADRMTGMYIELQKHPAWIHIAAYLDKKINFYRRQLEEKDIESMDELLRIRSKIRLCEQFRNLPDIMIGLIEKNEAANVDFDPYE